MTSCSQKAMENGGNKVAAKFFWPGSWLEIFWPLQLLARSMFLARSMTLQQYQENDLKIAKTWICLIWLKFPVSPPWDNVSLVIFSYKVGKVSIQCSIDENKQMSSRIPIYGLDISKRARSHRTVPKTWRCSGLGGVFVGTSRQNWHNDLFVYMTFMCGFASLFQLAKKHTTPYPCGTSDLPHGVPHNSPRFIRWSRNLRSRHWDGTGCVRIGAHYPKHLLIDEEELWDQFLWTLGSRLNPEIIWHLEPCFRKLKPWTDNSKGKKRSENKEERKSINFEDTKRISLRSSGS